MKHQYSLRRLRAWILAGLCCGTLAAPLPAQVSRADSAAVLLGLAQRIAQEGNPRLAHALMEHVVRKFHDTQAASDAIMHLNATRDRQRMSSGRAGFTVSNTLFGAWLGVAIPAALGAETAPPYGAGLLIGAPAGFIGSKLVSNSLPISSGQAITTTFATWWGTWQAVGWRDVLNIGSRTEQFCYGPPPEQCETVELDSDRAPFTAAVIGGLGGLLAGGALAQAWEPTAGTATTVQLSSLWGAWFGLGTAILTDRNDGDERLVWTLVGSNAGLLASALTAQSWEMSSGRAWLISAAGLAGGFAGLGFDLLIETGDAQASIVAPLALSAGGLLIGAAVTRGVDSERFGLLGRSGALIEMRGSEVSVGPILPTPKLFPHPLRPESTPVLGLHIPLFAAHF